MLKRFFLNALSSFVGAWIALVLFGVAAVLIGIGIAAQFGAGSVGSGVKSDSILKIELNGTIEETETNREVDANALLSGNLERPATLNSLVTALKEAKENKNVKLLYLDCMGVSASPATLNALRSAIADFKSDGKKVYAYADQMSQGDYFVASVADSIFLNPTGSLSLSGLGGTSLYFKNLFDKLGVKFTVCKVGTFKSAVEPYISDRMSEPARAQLDTLYGNIWQYLKAEIVKSRNLKADAIDKVMANGITDLLEASYMKKAGLVDRLVYRRQINEILARETGQNADDLGFVSPSDLVDGSSDGAAYASKRQVAVLYATGEIAEGSKTGINCETLVPEIVKLADDDNVKALVMRVNSPGGSVFGSEQIAEALNYFKSKGKPFVVSMGDYAASGGYWISADADRIFADELTITGSIGIFGLFPEVSGLLAKLGVDPQTVQTNPGSSLPTLFTPMPESKHAEMQRYIEKGYDQFISRVAKGRKMKESKVRLIAEGRVWDGATAKRLGLVDELGLLADAVMYAAKEADLADNYDVAVYPRFEPGFWDLLPISSEFGLSEAMADQLRSIEPNEVLLREGLRILQRKPIQALAPQLIIKL